MLTRLISIGKAILSAIPGLAIVTARGGGGVFNAFKFADHLSHLLKKPEINSTSPAGITLATVGLTGAVVVNTYTRFFNLYRKESAAKKTPLEEKLLGNNPEKPKDPSCCYPGVETGSWNVGYKISQVVNGIYCWGSGSSGIVNMHSIVNLCLLLTHLEYNGKCGKDQSSPEKLVIVNLAMLLLIHANVKSFIKYNIPRLREYYRKLFIEEGWRDVSYKNYFGVVISAGLSTIGVWFGNQSLVHIARDEMFCHIPGGHYFTPSDNGFKIVSAVGATANFITSGFMTTGAIFNSRTQIENQSEFGCMEILIKLFTVLNAINMGLGSFAATSDLPKTLAGKEELTTHPGIIALSIFAALNTMYGQYQLDTEGLATERKARKLALENKASEHVEQKKERPTFNPPDPNFPSRSITIRNPELGRPRPYHSLRINDELGSDSELILAGQAPTYDPRMYRRIDASINRLLHTPPTITLGTPPSPSP